MTDDNELRKKSCNLRKRAEEKAGENAARTSDKLSPEETKRLLHELQVHQIELEMQNEELRRAQTELEVSRARYFDLYDLAPVGYLTISDKGLILEANLTASRLLGVDRNELVNLPLTRCILPDDQDIYYLHRKIIFETSVSQSFDIRFLRTNAAPFWARVDATAEQNANGVLECRAVVSDISESQKADEKLRRAHDELDARVRERTGDLLQVNERLRIEIAEHMRSVEELAESQEELRELARHLQSIREDERLKISREIHDELGQMLTALKMDLDFIKNDLPEAKQALYEKVDSDISMVDEIIRSIKRICDELRPSILDHFGIEAAIEWHAGEFQKSTGTRCKVESGLGDCDLDRDHSTALFRILQEALTNVARHSGATAVEIKLQGVDSGIVLQISDNGKGINPEQQYTPKSFGLIGMRERVYQLGGDIEIASAEGKGTTIKVIMPVA